MRIYLVFLLGFLFSFTVLGMKEDKEDSKKAVIEALHRFLKSSLLFAVEEQEKDETEIEQLKKDRVAAIKEFSKIIKKNPDLISEPFIKFTTDGENISPIYKIWYCLYELKGIENSNNSKIKISEHTSKHIKKVEELLVELVKLSNPLSDHYKYNNDTYDLIYVFVSYSLNFDDKLYDTLFYQIYKNTKKCELTRSIGTIKGSLDKIDENKISDKNKKRLLKLMDKMSQSEKDLNRRTPGQTLDIEGLDFSGVVKNPIKQRKSIKNLHDVFQKHGDQ